MVMLNPFFINGEPVEPSTPTVETVDIVNPGFEDDAKANVRPTGWTTSAPVSQVFTDITYPYRGGYACRIGMNYSLSQTCAITGGRTYVLTYYALGNETSNIRVKCRVAYSNGRAEAFNDTLNYFYYVPCRHELTVPDDAQTVTFEFTPEGGMMLDDVSCVLA